MCCALVSYVLSNVYMLQSEVNWFLCIHAAQSDGDSERNVFSDMLFYEPQRFGDETESAVAECSR